MASSSSPFDPRRYPIVIRIVDGYLEVSQPDLHILQVRGKFDDVRKAEEIGRAVLDVMNEATRKYVELVSSQESTPSPSQPKAILDRPQDPVLTIREVAKYLGISADTVRRLSNDGKLNPFMTPGGHRRYRLKEIEKYLNSQLNSHG